MMTQDQAKILCEFHEVYSLLKDEAETGFLEERHPEVLEAIYALHRLAVGTPDIPPEVSAEDEGPEELPFWAEERSDGNYMEAGAQLRTRDGRKIGNAVVSALTSYPNRPGRLVATIITDAGNMVQMTLDELQKAFYPPTYIVKMSPNEKKFGWVEMVQTLRNMIQVQCTDGNWNFNPYMLGMANGMIFALSIFEGGEPKYLSMPSEWLEGKKASPIPTEPSEELKALEPGVLLSHPHSKWVHVSEEDFPPGY